MTEWIVTAKGWGHESTRRVWATSADMAVAKVQRELGITITAAQRANDGQVEDRQPEADRKPS